MASPLLHIKDSYYFEVPKSLWPVSFGSKSEFTGSYETWLRLDPEFQLWEADRFYDRYAELKEKPEAKDALIHEYVDWKHAETHAGKPFWRFISEQHDKTWYEEQVKTSPSFQRKWDDAIEATSGPVALSTYRSGPDMWSGDKLDAYGRHLSGKVLIPQPFGRLRNLYEREWGVCISKFMIIEVAVALVLWALFSWLARNVETGNRPRGSLWNLLEFFVVFIRDEVARPVIGHEPHSLVAHAEAVGHDPHASPASDHHAHGDKHAHAEAGDHAAADEHEHHHDPRYDADRFVPLLLTIFFFVLGCNLSGLLPWLGSPTGVWGTTSAIAVVTLITGIVYGVRRFGPVGYLLNQIPGMDLPFFAAVLLKPMIFAIEIMGLLIKHTVLSIRLLANILAGHMVLVSIVALAFSLEGAASWGWYISAPASIIGCTLLSCLELFVAFLQAYIFTFLSAMFIGAAIHHH